MRKIAITILMLAIAGLAQASFEGRNMEGRFYFPTLDPSDLRSTDSWTVGPGVEISGFPSGDSRTDLDVSASNILMTYTSSSTWSPAAQNGPVFEVLSPGADIAGVTINPATDLPGFDITRVSWTANTITVNWEGLAFQAGQVMSLDVQFADQESVPVPTLGMNGLFLITLLMAAFGIYSLRRTRTGQTLS